MASGGESPSHRKLKQAALAWAESNAYLVRACEIRLPHSAYRADVVAYRPSRSSEEMIGQSAVFECKQVRGDFLKDAQSMAPSLDRLKALHRRKTRLEALLGVHFPSLRSGDSLFPEYETVACEKLEHRTWKRVTREIRILENRVHHKTKFEKMARYRCANLLYLVTIGGLVELHEVPSGWGILTCSREDLEGEMEIPPLELMRKPELIEVDAKTRLDLVQRIAAAVSRRLNVQLGLEQP